MIRSWSDSTSQSAVLITWTTPRDFELLHRSEGFWYELEQRLASEPESAWHNVYKGVERTFVCKNMQRGTKYLFRCCVCVARHRYSHWSPEVLIIPGSGYPEGKQNLVAPEISKALEQEVARNFTSGAVSAAGSSSPAVVTTVIMPISPNHSPPSSSSSPSQAIPISEDSTSPATASLSPSPTCQNNSPGGISSSITTFAADPVQAASTIVTASTSSTAAAQQSQQTGSPPKPLTIEVETIRGRKQKTLPASWGTFIPGPFYDLSDSNKVATASQPNAIVVGHILPKTCNMFISVQMLHGAGIFFGLAPSGINQSVVQQHLYQGWFLETSTLSVGSRPPYKWKAKPAYPRGDASKQSRVYFPHEGDIVTLNFNSKTNCLRFSTMPGTYLSGKYTGLLTPSSKQSLVPVVVLVNTGDSVLLHSAVQCSL